MLSLWRRHSGHFGRCSFLYRPINKCLFSYGSQFSSGLEDHGISDVVEDDEINQNKPQLVCRKCTTPIINTENVILFKWKNGIHLASINDNPLKNLFPRTNCDQATHHSWKKYKLHCMRCDHGVGILANIRNRARSKNNNDDKILFSSKDCSIQMPPHQSPLLSSSGYPSSILSFRMWTELIAACETQPELKEALQIRRADSMGRGGDEVKMLNDTILLAKDLPSLLEIIDQKAVEMNRVNILTALDRVAKFKEAHLRRHTQPFNTSSFSSTSSLKSEAPEDQLMFQLLENSRSNLYYQTNKALKSREFWKLIDEVERLVQFSVNSFGGNGLAASYLVSSLMKLRIGRESILIPLATHVIHCMKNNQMDIQSAIYIANGITSLASKEIHQDPQILSFMDHTNLFVQEYIKNNNDTHEIETNQLIILLHAGLKIDRFYEPLGQILFERLQNEKQWKEFYSNCSSSSIRLNRFLKYLYQLHLDGILHKKHHHHLYFYDLKIQEELKKKFKKKSQTENFSTQHLIKTNLIEPLSKMEIVYNANYEVNATGYILDIAIPGRKIGFDIHAENAYQIVPNMEKENQFRLLGEYEIKARHLKKLGWSVVPIPLEYLKKLKTDEEKNQFLSTFLEIHHFTREITA